MMGRFLMGAALAAAAGATLAGGQPSLGQTAATAAATFADDAARNPIRFDFFRGSRIFFRGTVNGHPAEIMLDSGAGMTVIDPVFAAGAGLTPGQAVPVRGASGMTEGHFAKATVQAGALTLNQTNVLLLDVATISRQIGRRIDVVLGRDAFEAGIVDLDFEKQTLNFRSAEGFAQPRGSVKVPVSVVNGIRRVPIAIEGSEPMLADLDLGNGASLLVSHKVWSGSAALGALRYARTQAGGVGGVTERRGVTLPAVTFAGQRIAGVPAVFNGAEAELPTDGANVGIDILQRFRMSLDFRHGAIYLTPLPHMLAKPLPKDRLGMRMDLVGDRLHVAYVSPDGPAAKAGWKAGDVLESVNGVAAGPELFSSRYARFAALPAGTHLDFVRSDGAHLPVTLADYF
jgi:hypothetical protein